MAVNFPTSLDTLTNPTATDYLNSPSHAGQHANANDILEALEAKVGINASAVTTSHDYKITALQTFQNTGWVPVSVSWSYAGADAPTFTITVPSGAAAIYSPGMRIKLTQTTVKYFIITAVADTVLTVYGGTDYTLVNAAISAISYSTQKAPIGFPLSPAKWTVSASIAGSGVNPTQNVWNNRGNIVLPIGVWDVTISSRHFSVRATTGYCTTNITLSTTNNGESDATMSSGINYSFTITEFACSFVKRKLLEVTSKTTYYLNQMTDVTGITNLGVTNGIITAVCTYL